ncbi:glycosyltransferase [Hymenobacter crusticola]|uniref:Glycosyltransferase 2-like domain-containing protein n=1 Tax=Hymenobacter crusticola TaxID=1770526 RepID=A0A243WCC3_9BACT|nr:glycosyltransferase [Hymenobacter crusticola]OUJ72391.1 hypothetical protein BXP70_18870 [Hymenobacter crusticola]
MQRDSSSLVDTLTSSVEIPATLAIETPPAPQLLACVVVPAKNEAARLPQTLAALAAQVDFAGQPLDPRSFEVIVLANNCDDATAATARRFAQARPWLAIHVVEITLPAAEAHVGRARRLLMDEACRRLEHTGNANTFLASTDADTHVAPTWLAAIRAELGAGNDAVGGRILTNTRRTARCAVHHQHLRDATYRILRARLESLVDPDPADPWPRHHQHFGASLALTPQAYRHVGGLPVVPYLEDEALYQALRRHDLRVRHSPIVQVTTSDRQTGRVAVGLSWQLRQWALLHQQRQEPCVECPQGLQVEWLARRQLRVIWQQQQHNSVRVSTLALRQLANTLGVPTRSLAKELSIAATFGALWHWVEQTRHSVGQWPLRWPPVPLGQALTEVRQLLRQHS